MPSFDFNNDRGFILTKKSLEKIKHKILSSYLFKSLSTDEEYNIVYKVKRIDGLEDEFNTLEDLFKEENQKSDKIKLLTIKALKKQKNTSQILIILVFSIREDSGDLSLKVEGNERDDVINIGKELKNFMLDEIINKEMSIFFVSQKIAFFGSNQFLVLGILWFVTGIVLVLSMLFFLKYFFQVNINIFTFYPSIIVTSSVALSIIFIGMIIKLFIYLFPPSVLLIGEEIENDKKRIELRKNIFWGGIVTTLISLVFYYLSR